MFNRTPFRIVLSIFLLASLLVACSPFQGLPASAPSPDADEQSSASAGERSLIFVPNVGQIHPQVLFSTLGFANRLFFTAGEVLLALPTLDGATEVLTKRLGIARFGALTPRDFTFLRLRFEGANGDVRVAGQGQLRGVVNYFTGNDPARWRTGVPTYATIRYQELYPGIDLVYSGHEGVLKGMYVVAPGADPGAIRWRYEGASGVKLRGGEVLIHMAEAGGPPPLVERRPVAWQTMDGVRVPVRVRYVVHKDGTIGFALGRYDRSRPLVIDPTLDYHTYLGGSGGESATDIGVDANNYLYIVGLTDSPDFPPPGTGAVAGDRDIFITKMDLSQAGANQMIYTTLIGGQDFDVVAGMAVDGTGNVYLAGETDSDDFPTTANAFQQNLASQRDGVVAQLDAAGVIQYASYLGGSEWDELMRVAVEDGLMYVVGFTASADFPTTANAYQAAIQQGDASVSVLDPSKSGAASLVYSTYYGGSGWDEGWVIDISQGIIYFAGDAQSDDLPLKNPIQATRSGGRALDAFLVKLDPSLSGDDQLLFATYLGGTGEEYSGGLAADSSGTVYWGGTTASQDFPTTDGSPDFGGDYDAFLVKVDTTNPGLVYSRFVGGSGRDGISDLIFDEAGNVYATGGTGSDDFPTVDPFRDTFLGGVAPDPELQWLGPGDPFVAKFDATGEMVFGTYLGGSGADAGMGIALGSDGNVYVAGGTASTDLDVVNPLQDASAGGYDLFIARIAGLGPPTPTPTATPTSTYTPTLTPTPTSTYTPTPTPTPTSTYTPTPTPTPTSTYTPTPTPPVLYLPLVLK